MGPRGATASPAYGRRKTWPNLRELAAALAVWPATTNPEDIERHRRNRPTGSDQMPRQTLGPLRPDLGLPGQGRRLGLLGRSGPCPCSPFLRLSRASLARADQIPLPNRKRRPRAGACGGRRAWAKQLRSQSDSPRCLRPTVRPPGGPSVGAQYLRDGDVVALEFTG